MGGFKRSSPYLQSPIFNLYHSEHEMLRYLKRLENRCARAPAPTPHPVHRTASLLTCCGAHALPVPCAPMHARDNPDNSAAWKTSIRCMHAQPAASLPLQAPRTL